MFVIVFLSFSVSKCITVECVIVLNDAYKHGNPLLVKGIMGTHISLTWIAVCFSLPQSFISFSYFFIKCHSWSCITLFTGISYWQHWLHESITYVAFTKPPNNWNEYHVLNVNDKAGLTETTKTTMEKLMQHLQNPIGRELRLRRSYIKTTSLKLKGHIRFICFNLFQSGSCWKRCKWRGDLIHLLIDWLLI